MTEWSEISLGELFKVKHGFAFKGEFFCDHETKEILVTPGNFSTSGGFQNVKQKFYNGPVPEDYILRPGDLVITMTDLSKEADTLGFGALIPDDNNIWLHNQRIGRVELHDESSTDLRFLNYILRSRDYRGWIVGSATGTTVKHTAPKKIEAFQFKIPPLPEQKAIAHILGSLDEKIELNRKMNQTLEAMEQGLFKSWFVDFDPVIDNAIAQGNPIPEELQARAEKRRHVIASAAKQSTNVIAPARRGGREERPKQSPNVIASDEGARQSYTSLKPLLHTNPSLAAQFPASFVFNETLGKWIPEGWEVRNFENLIEAKQGKYLPMDEMSDTQKLEFQFPVWGGNGIRGYSKKAMHDENVIVLTCRGSNCGLLGLTESPSWVSNIGFSCISKIGSIFFAYQALKTCSFDDCISGSAQPQITYTALKGKLIPIAINERIVREYSKLMDLNSLKILENKKEIVLLTQLRDRLLPELISGRVRVKED